METSRTWNDFIPIIEENGFIRKVDYYIWQEACNFINRCENEGFTFLMDDFGSGYSSLNILLETSLMFLHC